MSSVVTLNGSEVCLPRIHTGDERLHRTAQALASRTDYRQARSAWRDLAMLALYVNSNWTYEMIGAAFGIHRGSVGRAMAQLRFSPRDEAFVFASQMVTEEPELTEPMTIPMFASCKTIADTLTPPAAVHFYARIWIASDSINRIEVWVHEFEPPAGQRYGAEWVEEHLGNYDRDDFAKRFKLPETGNFQVLCTGDLHGWKCQDTPDSMGEYDERMDLETWEAVPLPADYFDDPAGFPESA
jgi:hypothetical protein